MTNINRLQNIKEKIETMNKPQHIDVLQLLVNNSAKISENNNGSFINLTELSEDMLDKLEEYINFIYTQNSNLLAIENKKDVIKQEFFDSTKNVIKNKCSNSIE